VIEEVQPADQITDVGDVAAQLTDAEAVAAEGDGG
jgi:hypothetical protein